jgi:hypothetical protein
MVYEFLTPTKLRHEVNSRSDAPGCSEVGAARSVTVSQLFLRLSLYRPTVTQATWGDCQLISQTHCSQLL